LSRRVFFCGFRRSLLLRCLSRPPRKLDPLERRPVRRPAGHCQPIPVRLLYRSFTRKLGKPPKVSVSDTFYPAGIFDLPSLVVQPGCSSRSALRSSSGNLATLIAIRRASPVVNHSKTRL
jgi:hypothetical protein